ncbi:MULTISPECIES: DUF4232 domain-containing protein [unclassified Streptomyces]|uniref:DUF4232 domain-containing protein n=1 Tax=unclassified Streptomyces TaxID=2593676 RepID=UPI0036ECE00E
MSSASRAVPAVLAGVLLLAGCGSERAPREGDTAGGPPGTIPSCPSEYARYGAPPASAPPTPSGTPTPLPLPSTGGPDEDGVQVTGLYAWAADSGCEADLTAEFEVTNPGPAAAAYTVTLGFVTASGSVVENAEGTVASVGPGRTAQGTVALARTAGHAPEVSGVRVVKVRSVPVGEAATASGPCPASGTHLYLDQGDAAMGLRVVGLHLVNCGTRPYALDGYPELRLLGADHTPIEGVRVLDGTERISTAVGGGGAPRPVTLRPGEAARTTLAWRNTTEAGLDGPVNVPYLQVRPKPGADPVTVVPELDLGTTGLLGVGPWEKDEAYRGTGTGTAPAAP